MMRLFPLSKRLPNRDRGAGNKVDVNETFQCRQIDSGEFDAAMVCRASKTSSKMDS